MKKHDYTIGVIGGMGSYATVDFFKRLVDSFPAEKEWDRPRIIIDNRCTMPSRVRAILYQENVAELVDSLCESTAHLLEMGASRLVLVCNTSHFFLKDIIERIPSAKDLFINIIEECTNAFREGETAELIASEGTIDSGIYRDALHDRHIDVIEPGEEKYALIRSFIEAVKQDKIDQTTMEQFIGYIDQSEASKIILGCTELPILYQECLKAGMTVAKEVIDPLQCAIDLLVTEYDSLS